MMINNMKVQRYVVFIVMFAAFSGLSCRQMVIRKMIREHMSRPDLAPALGSVAPNFTLKTLDGKREVELASFRGKKPVVLVFGSYT